MTKKVKEQKVKTQEISNIDRYLENALKSFPNHAHIADDDRFKLSVIPSGIQALDNIINGGFRRKGLCIINGAFSTGKTFTVYHTIKTAQELGNICVFIDAENRFEREWAKKIGIDTKKLLVHSPKTGEEAFKNIYYHLKNGADLIAIDSFALFLPSAMAEAEDITPSIGLQARLMSQGLIKVLVENEKSVVLATNQLRADIGTRFHRGILEKMVGGNAQYFDASAIIQTRRKGFLVDKGEGNIDEEEYDANSRKEYPKVGFVMECVLTKCGYAPPLTKCQVNVNYIDAKVDNLATFVDIAVDRDIIKQTSAGWYEYNGDRIQGRMNLYDLFRKDHDKFEALKSKVV